MANRVITIPEPTSVSEGLRVAIDRRSGTLVITVLYESQNIISNAVLREADFTAAQWTKLNDFLSALVTKAATKMGF